MTRKYKDLEGWLRDCFAREQLMRKTLKKNQLPSIAFVLILGLLGSIQSAVAETAIGPVQAEAEQAPKALARSSEGEVSLLAASLPGADRLAQEVLEANPTLQALESKVEALELASESASAWMDPVFAAEYSNMVFARPYPGGHAMSGLQLRLQQTFPFPGKIKAREAAANAKIKQGEAGIVEGQNRLIGAVRVAFVRLALVRQLRKVTQEHIKLVQQLADVVQVRSEVGRANQVDLQRLLLLRDKLEDDLGDFGRDERRLLAKLNATLHRPQADEIKTPAEFVPPQMPQLEALVEACFRDHPEIKALQAAAATERLDGEQAALEGRPDLTTWIGYRVRVAVPSGDLGEDMFSVGASLPLPWFWNDRRWGSKARMHQARARSIHREIEALKDRLRGSIGENYASLKRSNEKQARFAKLLVPEAHAVLDASFAVYPTGMATFDSVFQAELQLLDFERIRLVAAAESWLSRFLLATDSAENLKYLTGSRREKSLEP